MDSVFRFGYLDHKNVYFYPIFVQPVLSSSAIKSSFHYPESHALLKTKREIGKLRGNHSPLLEFQNGTLSSTVDIKEFHRIISSNDVLKEQV